MSDLLTYAQSSGFFTSIDCHFAKTLSKTDLKLQLLALIVSRAYGSKHTMVPLRYIHHERWFTGFDAQKIDECMTTLKHLAGIDAIEDWAPLFAWIKQQPHYPLAIANNGVYLAKNLHYETIIVDFLKRHQDSDANMPSGDTIDLLHQLFPRSDEIDHQKIAAVNALLSPTSIISGGPGTGKTTTVIRILMLLLNEHPNLHISLAAPTGKAAARLSESIEKQKTDFKAQRPELTHLLDKIPSQSTTLHRLLSFNPNQIKPRYHAYHPLPTDLIIIDEASMIDLYIFNLLIEALPPHVRIIILGDKDQLASVEAGAIMGEICQNIGYDAKRLALIENIMGQSLAAEFTPKDVPLNNVTLLTKSHRFSEHSGIGQLAKAVNEQHARSFMPIVAQFPAELTFINTGEVGNWRTLIHELLADYVALCQNKAEPRVLFDALQKVRILSAINVSEFGTHALNEYISTTLFNADGNGLYHGQAIMILQNDYVNHIFNGDVGIITEDNGRIIAYFESDNGELRALPVQLLPHYETAFAMTIHKSQGSEFDHVMLVLPDFYSKILTKELLYTGITRAKKQLTLMGTPRIIETTIRNHTERFSGIGAQLNRMS